MSFPLSNQSCVPCSGNVSPISDPEMTELKAQIPDWQILQDQGIPKLQRQYAVKNFRQALQFTQRVGELAEQENHHPAILTEWGKVTVTWWTHAIAGLHRNDFIMAAKTDINFFSGRLVNQSQLLEEEASCRLTIKESDC
ncbi:4a-hydroxytetrahydrobiopterin dehydratase [Lyngbya confervoides]|uniref:Putative pterin-4-alpha-carbinolamine dehydratase n=1 Tax=Lyngbya confervoides BDU141951 TaxID=1574623 RepID=A0ABD4T8P8_9CYAN|nr:4a-hydroxytetrahydrobiopterin dehydratase [Lyngbya confervoides]MCM1984952.1 4a-hydroxytetrahydrobiopterin dehydratase [Lyngbya confervoides BDU141951]